MEHTGQQARCVSQICALPRPNCSLNVAAGAVAAQLCVGDRMCV